MLITLRNSYLIQTQSDNIYRCHIKRTFTFRSSFKRFRLLDFKWKLSLKTDAVVTNKKLIPSNHFENIFVKIQMNSVTIKQIL